MPTTIARGSPTALPTNVGSSGDATGALAAQPLVNHFPVLTSRSIYDWTRLNLAAPNYDDNKSEMATVTFDQTLFSTARQSAFVQLGWFRETTERQYRNLVGFASGYSTVGMLQIDVNERLLDGQPNPNFGRTMIGRIFWIQMGPSVTSSHCRGLPTSG